MRPVIRLIRYVLPFLTQLLPGVFLLAAVGFLEAFRLVLLKPVLDRVLNPSSGSENIVLFTIPQTGQPIYLQRFVPTHFHNAWTIVAYALVASKGGSPSHPTWYHNLVAHPTVEIQDGAERRDYGVRVAEGEEREQWWARAVDVWPDYAAYQEKTDREIPVFIAEPV